MISNPDQSPSARRNEESSLENLLFWGMVILSAGYVWLFDWFPTQDGPSHVDSAVALFKLLSGRPSILNDYYQLNPTTYTNWLGALLLGGLTRILPLFQAEKVLLCGYLVLMPVTFRYALKGLGRGSAGLVFFIFPLLYSRLFFMGFYSFCYSLIFFFITIGYWFRHRQGLRPASVAMLTGLSLATLLWHLFSLIMAALVMASTVTGDILVQAVKDWRSGVFSPAGIFGVLVKKMIAPVIILLPSLVLVGAFLGHTEGGITNWINPARLAGHLVAGTVMINFGWWELGLSGAYMFSLGLVGWLILRSRGREPWGGLALGLAINSALVTLLYLVMPDGTGGGGTISFRLALFTTLAAIILAGGRVLPPKARLIAVWAPLAVSLLFLVFRYQPLAEMNGYLEDYLAGADHIEEGRTILPVSFLGNGHPLDRKLAWRVYFFSHAGGYLSAAKGGVNLRNYEARMSYFPVIYRPGKNPYVLIGMEDGESPEPAQLDFAGYPRKSGGRVDYVLLWCYDPERNREPASLSIMEQLKEGYRLRYTSPRGLMRIYGRD